MNAKAVSIAVVALLGLVAGCGGGDDTTSITKAEFVTQANQICKQAYAAVGSRFQEANDEVSASGKKISRPEQEAKLLEVFKAPYEQQIEEFRELPIPEGEEETVEAIAAAMESSLEQVEEDPYELGDSIDQFTEINELAAAYGIEDCVF